MVLKPDASYAIRSAPLTASFGLLVVLVYVVAAVFAPVIAPFGEAEVIGGAYAPPDDKMILGGDQLGRDLFSRLIYGARNTVGIAFLTTMIAFVSGTLLGLVAATVGGWVDQIMSRIVDTIMAIPQLVFALLLLTIFGANMTTLILVIGFLYTPLVFRLARAVAGNIVVMDYIEAAKLRGESTWYLITREILPNAAAPLVAEFGLRFCFVFLAIAALSFLGTWHSTADSRLGVNGAGERNTDFIRRHHAADPGRSDCAADCLHQFRRRLDAASRIRPEGIGLCKTASTAFC